MASCHVRITEVVTTHAILLLYDMSHLYQISQSCLELFFLQSLKMKASYEKLSFRTLSCRVPLLESAGICVNESKLSVISLSLLKSYYTSAAELSLFQGTQVALSLGDCRIGSSIAEREKAEAPISIASGVILTCSLPVKSQMFWFILSPLSICLGLLFSNGRI